MRLRKRVAFTDDEQAATEHLVAASAIDLGDFLDFDVRRTGGLNAAAGFRTVRYSIRADLAGRRFEQFPVDVALGEHCQELVQWLRVLPRLAAPGRPDAVQTRPQRLAVNGSTPSA
jgi:hypothetical protein